MEGWCLACLSLDVCTSIMQDIEPAPVELAQIGHGAERGVDEPDSFVALHALAVDSRCRLCPLYFAMPFF